METKTDAVPAGDSSPAPCSALSMGWIDQALSANPEREMTLQWDRDNQVYKARLEFMDVSEFIQGIGSTPQMAIAALEAECLEDAADEMMRQGAV